MTQTKTRGSTATHLDKRIKEYTVASSLYHKAKVISSQAEMPTSGFWSKEHALPTHRLANRKQPNDGTGGGSNNQPAVLFLRNHWTGHWLQARDPDGLLKT